ncbi:hypothetical protein SPRA44_10102 [Serratia proteamaculans]|nr:hypothetical protein SPRA44_10102 [Serratia proteamaculans]
MIEGKAQFAYGDAEMAELGKTLAEQVCQSEPRPDGVIALNDMLAIGMISALQRLGGGRQRIFRWSASITCFCPNCSTRHSALSPPSLVRRLSVINSVPGDFYRRQPIPRLVSGGLA